MSPGYPWSNGNPQGRLTGGEHDIRLADAEEIAEAINRLRGIIYRSAWDYSSHVHSGAFVRKGTYSGSSPPPFQAFRDSFTGPLLVPAPEGIFPGSPPSPTSMVWLCPSGTNEGKVLVHGSEPGEDEVNFFQELNGDWSWTDSLTAGVTPVRAVHINELRKAAELLSRGRWVMPIYLAAGIFSMLPDTSWVSSAVANNGTDEVRALGYALLWDPEDPQRGLYDVTILSSSRLVIFADRECTIQAHRYTGVLDFYDDLPTWNSTSGGVGTVMGSVALQWDDDIRYWTGTISGGAVAAALQAIVDGAEPGCWEEMRQNFMLRRTDTADPVTAVISASLAVEFDVNIMSA